MFSKHMVPDLKGSLIRWSAVAIVHLLMFGAIVSGLASRVTTQVQDVIQAALITESKPTMPKPAPVAPAKVSAPSRPDPVSVAPVLPTPSVATAQPSDAAITVASAPKESSNAHSAPVKSEPRRVAAVINSSDCVKPEYPALARRMGHSGTVVLRFLVGVDGKVVQSEIEKTSGHPKLDEAARAGLSLCAFKPGTVDGKPEQSWATIRYTWQLE